MWVPTSIADLSANLLALNEEHRRTLQAELDEVQVPSPILARKSRFESVAPVVRLRKWRIHPCSQSNLARNDDDPKASGQNADSIRPSNRSVRTKDSLALHGE